MRKTKIICTLGPATEAEETLRQLIAAGANVFRLNMSHAPHEWVREIVARIRRVSQEMGIVVSILMDTQGPAIRTGDLSSKLNLHPGDIFEFTVLGEKSTEQYSVDVNYDGLVSDISVGDVVLVDNGVIRMKVLEKTARRIRCEVLTEGTMGSRRHINLPGVKVSLPALTEKDIADVQLGCELGVDLVALSFCREPGDVEALRDLLQRNNSSARIVAKLEDQMAIRNVDEIVRKADVVMIARGDLGIECPMEELPIIQRRIIKRCLRFGRPVIVATHMLESMISSPMPTRAEVTDVANAVYEQADAIMLSGETTVGKYPVECVSVLDRIASRIERSGGAGYSEEALLTDPRQKILHSAVVLANSFSNSRIVVFTQFGTMANYVAHLRPLFAPIFAFTPNPEVCRQLTINWGVLPVCLPFEMNPNRTIGAAERYLVERDLVKPGMRLIVVSDMLSGEDRFLSVQLREVHGEVNGADAAAEAATELSGISEATASLLRST